MERKTLKGSRKDVPAIDFSGAGKAKRTPLVARTFQFANSEFFDEVTDK
jgi:hypothetical protein